MNTSPRKDGTGILIGCGIMVVLGTAVRAGLWCYNAARQCALLPLVVLLCLGAAGGARADQLFQFSFTPYAQDQAQGIVKFYSLYQQATNTTTPNSWTWIMDVPIPTNGLAGPIMGTITATNLPAVCNLTIRSQGISLQSDPSAPFFFDYQAELKALVSNTKPHAVSNFTGQMINSP